MTYGRWFYRSRRKWVQNAAESLLPTILCLGPVSSLVDVGCGTALWGAMAGRLGVKDVVGVDGPWVRREDLEIAPSQFVCADLSEGWSLDRQFDMVMSLEVAEHLPRKRASSFVEKLTRLGPLVVFSAAIPGQGGQCHVNEQWPSYWIGHFERRGYRLFDVLRPRIWKDGRIPYWYRQNLLVFARGGEGPLVERLEAMRDDGDFEGADLVHPDHARRALQYPGLMALGRAVPFALLRTLVSLPQRLRGGVEPEPMRELSAEPDAP